MKLTALTTLPSRITKALALAKITTTEEVIKLTEQELLSIKSIGEKSVKILLEAVPNATPTSTIKDKKLSKEERREKRRVISSEIARLLDLTKDVYIELGFIEESDRGVRVIDTRGRTLKAYLVDPYSQKNTYGLVTTIIGMIASAFYAPQERTENFNYNETLELKQEVIDILAPKDALEFTAVLQGFKTAKGYNSFAVRDSRTNLIIKTHNGDRYMEGVRPDIEMLEEMTEELLEELGFDKLTETAIKDINKYSVKDWEKAEKKSIKRIKKELKKNKKNKKELKDLKAGL